MDMSPLLIAALIVVLLILIGVVTYFVAVHGRKTSMPEEVTKGIKSETPFPSPISSNHSKHHDNYRQANNSKGSSTFDLINSNEPYIPSDFVINDSTFIVRKEFIPKSVDELPIKKNQILSVKEIYEDGWCMAISVNTGEMGVVPFQCLYKYTDLLKKKRSYQKQKQKQIQQQPPIPNAPNTSQYCQPYTTPPIVFNN